ncbi:hypothetical protein [Parvularcula marina]|uniref:hypothetical protein n=1 Tax=Parvularcula marina TaxID=2292771 RepID=UPI0035183FC6
MTGFLIASFATAVAALAVLGYMMVRARRGIWSVTCDLRRCLVIIGPEQNDETCIAQRRALKPLLMRVRHIGMNVIELYGSMTPRRNGRPLEWLDNGALRRALKVGNGFSLICLDDESEIILRSQKPVSENALSEFIAMEEPIALPAPDPAPIVTIDEDDHDEEAPAAAYHYQRSVSLEPETSWGRVGVLR